MDRRSFIQLAVAQMAVAAPVFAQVGKRATPGGRAARPAPPPAAAAKPVGVPWTQWGGPHRNFQTEASRHQGHVAGHRPARRVEASARRRLFVDRRRKRRRSTRCTASRREEVVLAANAETGQTFWEQAARDGLQSDAPEMGNGPYSTPLIVGDRLFTTGVAGRLQCLDKKIGQGALDAAALGGPRRLAADVRLCLQPDRVSRHGHRAGRRTRARRSWRFSRRTARSPGRKHDFGNVYSSPILINVEGLEQLGGR